MRKALQVVSLFLTLLLTTMLSAKEATKGVRQDFAASLEQTLLDMGNDTHCYTQGAQAEELWIEGGLVGRVFANDFARLDDGKLWKLVVGLQFSTVSFRNTITKERWSYDTGTRPSKPKTKGMKQAAANAEPNIR